MRTRRLVRVFPFTKDVRAELTLGNGTRLSPAPSVGLTLAGAAGSFPTDDDLQARTRVWHPRSAIRWLSFEVVGTFPKLAGAETTRAGFRLSDGTLDYAWNGTVWAAQPVTDGLWSTEAELANHVGAFMAVVASRKLQLVVNLKTDSAKVAPSITALKVLWASDLEPQEDIIVDSLLGDLSKHLRPRAEYKKALSATAAVSTFTVAALALETPYEVMTIDAVFDDTADPSHFVDLLSGYNQSTATATLSAPLPAGHVAHVRFLYRPVVAMGTSQDYDEVAALPAVIVRDVVAEPMVWRSTTDSVVNRAAGSAVVVPAPAQGDLDMRIETHADKLVDHQRLASELQRYFGNTPLLRSRALDEDFRLWVVDDYSSALPADGDDRDIIRGEMSARIVGVLLYHRDAYDTTPVLSFKMTGLEKGEETIVQALNVFWGNAAAGTFNAAFIQALAHSDKVLTLSRSFDVEAATGQHIYVATPVSFGTPIFRVGSFEGIFHLAAHNVSVAGVNYDLWESDALGLGPTHVEVS